MKKNKWKILLSSAVILLPVLAGLLLWSRLPDVMTTHWGADGVADGQNSKAFTVFVPFFILLGVHWLCLLLTKLDRGNQNQSQKAMGIVCWIIPVTSLCCGGMIYGTALGKQWNYLALMPLMLGLMFMLLGNYMPKVRQNKTLGVKVPWTLNNEGNWNKTHRFCGWVWTIGGAGMLLAALLPEKVMIPAVLVAILVLSFAPMLYSYCLYRRQLKQGMIEKQTIKTKGILFSIGAAVIILAGIAYLLFSGDITVTFDEASFTVSSTYWRELTVEYDAVDSVEYREEQLHGLRTYGFGSPHLSLGNFYSEELGVYQRYTYGNCDSWILIRSEEKTLVLNGADTETTKDIFAQLQRKIG